MVYDKEALRQNNGDKLQATTEIYPNPILTSVWHIWAMAELENFATKCIITLQAGEWQEQWENWISTIRVMKVFLQGWWEDPYWLEPAGYNFFYGFHVLSLIIKKAGVSGKWLLGVRKQEREWIIPFPKVRNGKGMKKNIPKIREWEGNENKSIPTFWERESEAIIP